MGGDALRSDELAAIKAHFRRGWSEYWSPAEPYRRVWTFRIDAYPTPRDCATALVAEIERQAAMIRDYREIAAQCARLTEQSERLWDENTRLRAEVELQCH